MNAVMEAINVTGMRTAPTMLVLFTALVRKDTQEMEAGAQVNKLKYKLKFNSNNLIRLY